jgi:hypothetical protein
VVREVQEKQPRPSFGPHRDWPLGLALCGAIVLLLACVSAIAAAVAACAPPPAEIVSSHSGNGGSTK